VDGFHATVSAWGQSFVLFRLRRHSRRLSKSLAPKQAATPGSAKKSSDPKRTNESKKTKALTPEISCSEARRLSKSLAPKQAATPSRVFTRAKTGRPAVSEELVALILRVADENRLWSPRDIAENLGDKFGIDVSAGTVAKYLRKFRPVEGDAPGRGQSWSTFIRNHLSSTIACDFATVTTLAFKKLYVLVILELETRRVLHVSITAHPTAKWATQQFREAIPSDHIYRFLIHDRGGNFSPDFDDAILAMGITPSPISTAFAAGECLRGTRHRHDAPRLSRSHHPDQRTPSAALPSGMEGLLQSRPPAHVTPRPPARSRP
jgi:hypothetical protein